MDLFVILSLDEWMKHELCNSVHYDSEKKEITLSLIDGSVYKIYTKVMESLSFEKRS